jgi:L-arabinose isomerase
MGESGITAADGARSAVRARLGILLITSGWFREVGVQGAGSDTSRRVELAGADIAGKIEEFADPVYDGVMFSVEDARKAARRMLAAGVDGVLLAPLMWCEDAIPRAALEILGDLPLVLWTYSPGPSLPDFLPFQLMLQGSGAVCTMQLSGMLRREGRNYQTVAGHVNDPALIAEIRALTGAMAVRREMRGASIGLLPFPCDQMSTTWIDEFALRSRYGIHVRPLELERFRRTAAECGSPYTQGFLSSLESRGIRVEVDNRNLQEGIRYAYAMERVVREEGLRGLAMNDVIPEMHACFGLRPCLCNPALSASGAVVSMEADVGAAVAMLALRLFTGDSPFYTEPFSVDYERNILLMGHAGYHDEANADPATPVRVVRDVEYENSDRFSGAVSYFKYRAGTVTALNSVWDGAGLRWCCVEGESLQGPAKLEGNCHLAFRPDSPVRDFFRKVVQLGVSQHWLFVPGRRSAEIAALCAILGVSFVDGAAA